MNEHRTAARWFAGLLVVGSLAVGLVAPAQADTGWNGTVAPARDHSKPLYDTGWNGT